MDVISQDVTEISFAYDSCIMNYSLASGTLKMQKIIPEFPLGHPIFISSEQMEYITLDFCFHAA